MKLSVFVLALASCLVHVQCDSGVYILSENLQQVLTSTALQWMPADKDTKNFDNAVIGTVLNTPDESTEDNTISGKPVYICRAKQNGIWVSGQVRTNERMCIVSLHGRVYTSDRYEILINIEDRANLRWVKKDKYSLYPPGAVTGGDDPYRNFVARKKSDGNALSYHVGKLDPSQNLGKYTVIDEHNKESEYEDGEVLVETEPIKYEFSKIKYDYFRKRVRSKPRILGQTILKNENEDGDTNRVDTVMSYNYTYNLNWGHGHGMLNGLPFDVFAPNGSKIGEGRWGIKEIKEKVEISQIEAYLAPGTAVNVTLRGNYVESEVPYVAMVTAHYKNGETMEREMKDSKIELGMKDVIPELGPIYFLHNNSFVPTTTTTTTTTTSTTTSTTYRTTTTEEVVPITSPDLENALQKKKKVDDSSTSSDGKHENSSMMSDGEASSLKKKEDFAAKESSSKAPSATSSLLLLLTSAILGRKLTT